MPTLIAPALAGVAATAGTAFTLSSFARIVAVRKARIGDSRPPSLGPGRFGSLLGGVQRAFPSLVARAGHRNTPSLIARAGVSDQLSVRDVAAARLVCLAGAAVFAPRLISAAPARMLPLAVAAWFFAAAELPLWWLRRTALRRASKLRAALPDALELMRACLSAGLPLRRGLVLVSEHCAEPIASELHCVAAETILGVPQSIALDRFAARNPLPEIQTLVSAMRQAERHGSPLAPVIAAQADEARRSHNREIVELGAKAGPKIQLVVAATIVPAALLGMAAVVGAAIARGDLHFF